MALSIDQVTESLRPLNQSRVADLTVLSQDIMRVPEAEIPETTCAMTIINGEVVYDARNTSKASP